MMRSITIVFLAVMAVLAEAQPGTLDFSFDPQSGPDSRVNCIALQSDGKILIGGDFTHYNGVARNRIARLNSDGTLDLSFNPGSGANDKVTTIAVQPNGKILLGGGLHNHQRHQPPQDRPIEQFRKSGYELRSWNRV